MTSGPANQRGCWAASRSVDAAGARVSCRHRVAILQVAAVVASLAAPAASSAQSATEQVPTPPAESSGQSAAGFEVAALSGARSATAVESTVAPVLDGAVLDDPAWALAPPATGFVQTQPDEGRPASERTEVRIVYTADTLYFGVICYDTDPSAIHRHRQPPRFFARRQRQLPAHPRHFPRSAERLHLRHQPFRPGVRRAARQRGGGAAAAWGSAAAARSAAPAAVSTRIGTACGRCVPPSPRWAGRRSSPSRSAPCASRPAASRPGASTSSATSAGATSRHTGHRCRGSTICSASRSPGNWAASGRPRGSGARCR